MSASGESSTTMHRLLHASGSHPIPTPYDPKTNQYNQDLGLIHSTNGNHLESPNEGSSIDHQHVYWKKLGAATILKEIKNRQLTRSARSGISDDDISSDVITINSCEEKRKSWISDDEVSNDVSNQLRATVQPAVDSADALCNGNNQQEATVHPVESYSVIFNQSRMHSKRCRLNNRKLQCTQSQATVFCISSRKKSRRKKSRRSEILKPDAKNPVAAVEDTINSEAVSYRPSTMTLNSVTTTQRYTMLLNILITIGSPRLLTSLRAILLLPLLGGIYQNSEILPRQITQNIASTACSDLLLTISSKAQRKNAYKPKFESSKETKEPLDNNREDARTCNYSVCVVIESLGVVFVVTVSQKYKPCILLYCAVVSYQDTRESGNTALSSPCWDLLATMRRVVNYHSSWARQQQVELFDASGNSGFTAGRGFSPAGGAPGGG
ncbi:hypothetical protein F511_19842 [Dorcoceras hygrometricum]|uniref:Uncharacterized protein n=1 Tax=Dorcoceras hygrometricum TaxID=472368 RepID=A0A2Z7BVW6_9LAMI|nr:hypothetical protein F511_19842 [Dorcoceras hygrometricum]